MCIIYWYIGTEVVFSYSVHTLYRYYVCEWDTVDVTVRWCFKRRYIKRNQLLCTLYTSLCIFVSDWTDLRASLDHTYVAGLSYRFSPNTTIKLLIFFKLCCCVCSLWFYFYAINFVLKSTIRSLSHESTSILVYIYARRPTHATFSRYLYNNDIIIVWSWVYTYIYVYTEYLLALSRIFHFFKHIFYLRHLLHTLL